MAATKRTKFQIERDRVVMARMYLKGKTLREIADALAFSDGREYKLSIQMIHRDMQIMSQRWVEMAIQNIGEVKGRELAKIDILELEAWQAWERSRVEQKRSKTGRRETGEPGEAQATPAKVSKKTDSLEVWKSEQHGDPRYLTTVQWCIEKRCKLLGLDAPQKMDVNWMSRIDWNMVTPEQNRRLADGEPVEKVFPSLIGNPN